MWETDPVLVKHVIQSQFPDVRWIRIEEVDLLSYVRHLWHINAGLFRCRFCIEFLCHRPSRYKELVGISSTRKRLSVSLKIVSATGSAFSFPLLNYHGSLPWTSWRCGSGFLLERDGTMKNLAIPYTGSRVGQIFQFLPTGYLGTFTMTSIYLSSRVH